MLSGTSLRGVLEPPAWSTELLSVGVTGTNGKTSTTTWLAYALAGSPRDVVRVTTLGVFFGDAEQNVESSYAGVLAALKQAKDQGARYKTDKSRRPCRKGHFFVVLADRDHIFFEYRAKHDSVAVCEMFRGYSGYIQADAHAIYDALHRGDAVDGGMPPPIEVACGAHARRKFWEAACARHALGREGLYRLRRIFELDASWDDKPPDARRILRQTKLRPFMDNFFAWAQQGHDAHKGQRGSVPSAFGYAVRQRDALRRVLEDGRLKLTNNGSERALRPTAAGRKAWLFFGSDDHAAAAANLFSLITSCRLHALDAEPGDAQHRRRHLGGLRRLGRRRRSALRYARRRRDALRVLDGQRRLPIGLHAA